MIVAFPSHTRLLFFWGGGGTDMVLGKRWLFSIGNGAEIRPLKMGRKSPDATLYSISSESSLFAKISIYESLVYKKGLTLLIFYLIETLLQTQQTQIRQLL